MGRSRYSHLRYCHFYQYSAPGKLPYIGKRRFRDESNLSRQGIFREIFLMNWRVLWSCFLLALSLSRPALGQSLASNSESSRGITTLVSDGDPTASADTSSTKKKSDDMPDPDRLTVVIYPVLGVAPIFGINVNVPEPSVPSHPIVGGGGQNVAASATSSFNGAAFFGFTVEKKWFYGEGNGMWTSISASRSNTVTKLNLSTDWWTGSGLVGVRFYRDFYATGGFHTLSLGYNITFVDFPTFSDGRTLWDPMIGMMWKRQFTRKWELRANVAGGGFGVGADEDIAARGQADWEFVKHFGLTFGWEVLHVEFSKTVPALSRTFTASQTMNGPMFGLGIYF